MPLPSEERKLGVCYECLKFMYSPVVYWFPVDVNDKDAEDWGFECPIHGNSKVKFIE